MQSDLDHRVERGLHVAIVMDGNGRWATRRGLPRSAGHRAGAQAVRQIVDEAPRLGIAVLTLFAFSSDNWRRPRTEVKALMRLLQAYLRAETERCLASGVRMSVIGRRDRLPRAIVRAIERIECATLWGSKLHVRIALDYSAREAIARAVARCARTSAPGVAPALDATVAGLGKLIADADDAASADVDLLIRTGGEQRLSDFLLWECAYAELYFTGRMWPDFGPAQLAAALDDFHGRSRRFGGLPSAEGVLAVADHSET
jgi:undecaprenyl diphosphate synthase